jgi:hypothetical protein
MLHTIYAAKFEQTISLKDINMYFYDGESQSVIIILCLHVLIVLIAHRI